MLRLLKEKEYDGKALKIKSGYTFQSLPKYFDFFSLIGKTYSHLWSSLTLKEKELLGMVELPASMEDFFKNLHAKHFKKRYSFEEALGLLCSAVTSNMSAMFAKLKAHEFGHPEKDPFKKLLLDFKGSLLKQIATPEIAVTGSCRKIDFQRGSRKFSARYIGLIQIFSRIIFYFCGDSQKWIRAGFTWHSLFFTWKQIWFWPVGLLLWQSDTSLRSIFGHGCWFGFIGCKTWRIWIHVLLLWTGREAKAALWGASGSCNSMCCRSEYPKHKPTNALSNLCSTECHRPCSSSYLWKTNLGQLWEQRYIRLIQMVNQLPT